MTEEDQSTRYADATFQARSGRYETYAARNADVHEIRGGTTDGTTPTSDAAQTVRNYLSQRGQRIGSSNVMSVGDDRRGGADWERYVTRRTSPLCTSGWCSGYATVGLRQRVNKDLCLLKMGRVYDRDDDGLSWRCNQVVQKSTWRYYLHEAWDRLFKRGVCRMIYIFIGADLLVIIIANVELG